MLFFSIIIPTFNRASLIQKTISQFLSQNYKTFELIIINDGSTDNTAEVVKNIKDERIKYYYIPNSERGAARNYGAKVANGEYLNFFDSDDTPYPNHLSNANEVILKNEYPPLLNVGYRIVNPDGHVFLEETNFDYDLSQRLIKTNFLGCNSVFVKKEIFLENLFNESRDLASSEDWELWLRLSSRYHFVSSNEVTFQINNHETRSLFTIPPKKIVKRDTLLIELLLKDIMFVKKYKKSLAMFISDRYTFFALIYSLTKKNRKLVLKYLAISIKKNFWAITEKRFWACLKHLI